MLAKSIMGCGITLRILYNLTIPNLYPADGVIWMYVCIKTGGSELQGQEEAACMHACMHSGLHNHYSELFTWIATLKL